MSYKKYIILRYLLLCVFVQCAAWNMVRAQSESPQNLILLVVDVSDVPIANALVHDTENNQLGITNEEGRLETETSSSFVSISKTGFESKVIRCRSKKKGERRISVCLAVEKKGYQKDRLIPLPYSVDKKKNVSSSVYLADKEIIETTLTSSFMNSLTGQVPGLTITNGVGSGEPGDDDTNFWIRGLNTLTYKHPLVLIDNIDRNLFDKGGGANGITNLPIAPEEIESVTVLKDAAAKAIYGMRGANGVILITTKRGGKEPVKISLNSEFGMSEPLSQPTFLNAYDHATLYNRALINDGGSAFYSDADLQKYRDNSSPFTHPNVNFYDEIIASKATQQNHSISFTGGDEKVQYYIVGSYFKQGGIVKDGKDFGYERYVARSNFNMQLHQNTELTMDIAFRDEEKSNPTTSVWSLFSGLSATPANAYPLYNKLGLLGGTTQYKNNPIGLLNNGFYKGVRKTYQGSLGLNQNLNSLVKGLSASIYFSLDGYNETGFGKKGSFAVYQQKPDTSGDNIEDYTKYGKDDPAKDVNETGSNKNFGHIVASIGKLRYNREFTNSKLEVQALINQWLFTTNSGDTDYARLDYGFQANYAYKDKYLVGLSGSYSGSEQFPEGNRFGFFPAASLGWVVSQEDGLKDNLLFDYLKLRASVGLTGNDKMSSNRYLYAYYWGWASGYSFNEKGQNGYGEKWQPNPDVSYEKSLEYNVGFDAELLNRRLFVTFDYFNNERSDILEPGFATVPDVMGFGQLPYINYGIVKNKGFEGQVNLTLSQNALKFDVGATVTYSKSTVERTSELERLENEDYLLKSGKSVDQQWGLVAEGLFKDEQEIASSPLQTFGMVKPGNIKYKDMNGDNVINDNDKAPIGNGYFPSLTYGLNLRLAYKQFECKALFQGACDYSVFLTNAAMWYGGVNKYSEYALNGWYEGNSDATYPRLTVSNYDNDQRESTYWQRDVDYIRLKSAEVSYTLPNQLAQKLYLSKCKLFVRGYNLLTFTSLDDFDPENTQGWMGKYPTMRIVSTGLNLEF